MLMFLMQPELRGYTGHPHQETLGWIDACRRRGVELEVFCSLRATTAVVDEIAAVPAFDATWEDVERFCRRDQFQDSTDPYSQPLTTFMIRQRGIVRGCAIAWASSSERPGLMVFPWADAALMNGVAEWLADVAMDERPSLAFNFAGPEPGWTVDRGDAGATGNFSFFRLAARRLAALAPPGRLLFTAVDSRLCQTISRIGQIDCRPAPLLQYYGDFDRAESAPTRSPTQRSTIGLLGHVRSEKGSSLMVDIIDAVCRASPGAGFRVQGVDEPTTREWAAQLRARGAHVHAEFNPGDPTRQDYVQRLASCDLILLPYLSPMYAVRPSGVFADALAMGLPVVAPAETWLADRLAEGWGAGETFGATEPQAIQMATSRALERLPMLKAKAEALKAEWRATHSVDAYMNQMQAWAGLGDA